MALALAVAADGNALENAVDTGSPRHVQQTWPVLNCNDVGAGSLRDVVQNHAQSDDIVDLSNLPTQCGTVNSTITLSTGEISIPQYKLTLKGPQQSTGTVTIRGSSGSRVFNHTGTGALDISLLHISDGHYEASGVAQGGCIRSSGEVYLLKSSVTGCTVSSASDYADGGGIYAATVRLKHSTVSGNEAIAVSEHGRGGGIRCPQLFAKYSSISDNVAHDGALFAGFGGGAYVINYAYVGNSTVDYNIAGFAGGIRIRQGTGFVVNSTISSNFADQDFGAIVAAGESLKVYSSTVAFNYSTSSIAGPKGAVLFVGASPTSALTLQSSIVAKNTAGAAGTPADVYLGYGYSPNETLAGSDNLVIASNAQAAPPGVITVADDPQLSSLDMHGGWTKTHMLLPGSPAIGMGNNDGGYPTDQRGHGYPRTSAASTDIGAVQFDSIFFDDFDDG